MATIELQAVITGLTEDTNPDPANDFTDTYDASASTLKKVRLGTLAQTPLSGSQTIRASYGVYVPYSYEVTSGATLEIAAGAVMEIG